MPAPEADQVLVQPVVRAAVPGQARRIPGELRPDRVVAALPLLLDAAERLLVAGVDRGDPGDGAQHHQHVLEVALVAQAAGDAGHVVVADERLRHERLENSLCRSQGPGQLEKLPSFSELQIAFHSSYWVTESSPPSAT